MIIGKNNCHLTSKIKHTPSDNCHLLFRLKMGEVLTHLWTICMYCNFILIIISVYIVVTLNFYIFQLNGMFGTYFCKYLLLEKIFTLFLH